MTTLTPRQLEILRLSAEGFSGPQIAVRLHVTVATVNEHRTRIRNRLGANTAAHAVAIAYQRGILDTHPDVAALRGRTRELERLTGETLTELDQRNAALSTLLRGMARRAGRLRKQCDEFSSAAWHLGYDKAITEREVKPQRTWSTGDPEPEDFSKVRDCHGDVWTRNDSNGLWYTPETVPCKWPYIAKKFSPLVAL